MTTSEDCDRYGLMLEVLWKLFEDDVDEKWFSWRGYR